MVEVIIVLFLFVYLEWEVEQEECYEYENGKLIVMGGSSKEYNKIIFNLYGFIWMYFRGVIGIMSIY